MNRENNQIRFFLLCCSAALLIVSILMLFYGAYLFNLGLISKSDIFISATLPTIFSISCIWRARK